MVVPPCSHHQFLQHLCLTAQIYQRTCVGSSVNKTVSSHVHHAHGSGASASNDRTGRSSSITVPQHQRPREHRSVDSASTPAHGYHNWSDDIRAVLETRHTGISAALKWVERRRDGSPQSMNFRLADVTKALASVNKICQRRNRVAFDEEGRYIENKTSGRNVPMRVEIGVYVVDVHV